MKMTVISAAATAIMLTGGAATAATFGFDLNDHPNGTGAATYDYGLRLDTHGLHFSFDNGADAYMKYDEGDGTNGTATLYGTLVESLGSGSFGAVYNFVYKMSGLTSTGGGGFIDFTGAGTGTVFGAGALGTDIDLGAASKASGEFFEFGLDALSDRPWTGLEGTGWVADTNVADDFLFTAEVNNNVPPPPNQTPPVPLPAAGWLLVAGLGGLGVMGRRKKIV